MLAEFGIKKGFGKIDKTSLPHMEHKLLSHFLKISPLTDEEKEAILDNMLTRTYQKGDYLLRAGQISTETYFVLEGLVREYVEVEGEEKTINFFTEDQWVISLNSFGEEAAATHNWVCAEDCTLVVGNEENAQELFTKFPGFETISRAIMESIMAEQKQALTTYLTASPENRYLKLITSRPSLMQRVPQYQLASYIGVKPESLSRIRKRVHGKG